MTFLLQTAAASTRSLLTPNRRVMLQAHHYRARFSSWSTNSRLLSSSIFVPSYRKETEYDRATQRYIATLNTKETTYRDRARAGMDKAKKGYKKGMTKARQPGGVQAMAKAGASTSMEKLKQYGPVFFGTYFSLYVVTWASIYAGVDSGLIDPTTLFSYISSGAEAESKNTADIIVDYLNHYAWTRPAVPFFEKNPHFANVGVAWVGTKFTEPFRLVIAMVVVPRLAKVLGYVPQIEAVVDVEDEADEKAADSTAAEAVVEASEESVDGDKKHHQ